MVGTWLSGLTTGLGLIVAIGAQNVFVLTQGMRGRYLVTVPLICFLGDVVLMTIGVGGLGSLLASDNRVLAFASSGGAIFLGFYGFQSLKAAFSGNALVGESGQDGGMSRGKVVAATLGVTFLNPHVYLDSIVLMGGIGSRFPIPERWNFLGGALSASFFWFFGLSRFGRLLAPVLSRPYTWRVVQILVCVLLWRQAVDLGRFAFIRWTGL